MSLHRVGVGIFVKAERLPKTKKHCNLSTGSTENEVRITFLYIYSILFTMQRKCWVLRFDFANFSKMTLT